jgi:Protein of unknown function (DUF4230)
MQSPCCAPGKFEIQMKKVKTNPQQASDVPRVILALAVAVVLVIAAGAGAFYFVAVKAPTDLGHNAKEESLDAAKRMAKGFQSVFHFTPRVTIGNTTVIEQAVAIAELATVQEDLAVHYTWSQTWVGSTKTMELQGVYKAKAGFDLHEPFHISVDEKTIAASFPAPKLLSLEMTGYKVLKDESGWWNSITPADRESAIGAMQSQAKIKAAETGLLTGAKTKFRQELAEAFKNQNVATPIVISFADETAPAKPLKQ